MITPHVEGTASAGLRIVVLCNQRKWAIKWRSGAPLNRIVPPAPAGPAPSQAASDSVADDEESQPSLDDDMEEVQFAGAVSTSDPYNYRQAIQADDSECWKEATLAEYNTLLQNSTWEIVDLPEDLSLPHVFLGNPSGIHGICGIHKPFHGILDTSNLAGTPAKFSRNFHKTPRTFLEIPQEIPFHGIILEESLRNPIA